MVLVQSLVGWAESHLAQVMFSGLYGCPQISSATILRACLCSNSRFSRMFYRVVKVELRQVQQHCELFASWNIYSILSGKFDESRLENGACDNVYFKIRIFSNAPPDCQTEPDTSFPTCGQFHYELKNLLTNVMCLSLLLVKLLLPPTDHLVPAILPRKAVNAKERKKQFHCSLLRKQRE